MASQAKDFPLREQSARRQCARNHRGEPDSTALNVAIQALLDAGHEEAVEPILEDYMDNPASHPAVGTWWMRRRIAHGNVSCTRQVEQSCPNNEAACQAVIILIETLAEKKRFWSVRALAWRNRRWLKTHDDAWVSIGSAYVRLGQYRLATGWFRDWQRHPQAKMWMLYNVALAQRASGKWKEAKSVILHALTLPDRDQTFRHFRLLFAMEEALAGHTKVAVEHVRELDETGWDHYMLHRYHYLRGMVAVQLAAPPERRQVFRQQRATIKGILKQHGVSSGVLISSRDYQRCMIRMAKDARQWWSIIPILCGA